MSKPTTTSHRSPRRLTRLPPMGAKTNSVAVQGSNRRPALKEPTPCPVWKNWGRKNTTLHRGIEEKAGGGACREGGHGKEAHGHHGFSGAHFPGNEADAESDADQQ